MPISCLKLIHMSNVEVCVMMCGLPGNCPAALQSINFNIVQYSNFLHSCHDVDHYCFVPFSSALHRCWRSQGQGITGFVWCFFLSFFVCGKVLNQTLWDLKGHWISFIWTHSRYFLFVHFQSRELSSVLAAAVIEHFGVVFGCFHVLYFGLPFPYTCLQNKKNYFCMLFGHVSPMLLILFSPEWSRAGIEVWGMRKSVAFLSSVQWSLKWGSVKTAVLKASTYKCPIFHPGIW